MDVLPKELPDCPGYDIAAFSLPAEQTGGDIYDLVAVALDPLQCEGPASLVLLLADATGHGIGSALSVTQVRSMLRIGMRLRAGLDDVFSQINRQLCQDWVWALRDGFFRIVRSISPCHQLSLRRTGAAAAFPRA